MRAVVTGSSGHVGSYVVPALVQAGYEVVAVTRGQRQPYTRYLQEWNEVRTVSCDRLALEQDGGFGRFVMDFKPDVICDLICYNASQAEQIARACLDRVAHYVFIGSIWVYEYNVTVPVAEGHPRNATSPYGRGKVEAEDFLQAFRAENGFPFTALDIGHVVGNGWFPLNPQGNFRKSVYEDIAAGRPILLPDRGTSTVHHVHGSDVGRMLVSCLENPDISLGQAYHVTADQAVTLRGFAESLYAKYGREPAIRYATLDAVLDTLTGVDRTKTFEHVSHSPCVSIAKARKELGYAPRYTALEAVSGVLDYMAEAGEMTFAAD